MTLPNFLIIGAMKAGTTSLYSYLAQHPQIYMSPVKEPRFFAPEAQSGSSCGSDRDTNDYAYVDQLDAYCALFSDVSGEIAIGEASPLYIYSPQAPEQIQHHIPDVKLIAILRDPAERAFSHFMHVWRSGREPFDDFAEALAAEEHRIQTNWSTLWHYRQRGFYGEQLTRYFDRFSSSQIKVFLSEDLRLHPSKTLKEIFQFLEVDDTFETNFSHNRNVAKHVPKNKRLHQLVTQKNILKDFLKPLMPARFRRQLRENVTRSNLTKPQLSPKIRRQLVNDYRDDILQVQTLIQRDLSHWLR